jgi:hypothetical protein
MNLNNVTIEMADPTALDQPTLDEICQLAADGFGRTNNEAMQTDTIDHVRSANALQMVRNNQDGRIEAFTMYARSLWRASHRACGAGCPA